jgi:hypothetical protein
MADVTQMVGRGGPRPDWRAAEARKGTGRGCTGFAVGPKHPTGGGARWRCQTRSMICSSYSMYARSNRFHADKRSTCRAWWWCRATTYVQRAARPDVDGRGSRSGARGSRSRPRVRGAPPRSPRGRAERKLKCEKSKEKEAQLLKHARKTRRGLVRCSSAHEPRALTGHSRTSLRVVTT